MSAQLKNKEIVNQDITGKVIVSDFERKKTADKSLVAESVVLSPVVLGPSEKPLTEMTVEELSKESSTIPKKMMENNRTCQPIRAKMSALTDCRDKARRLQLQLEMALKQAQEVNNRVDPELSKLKANSNLDEVTAYDCSKPDDAKKMLSFLEEKYKSPEKVSKIVADKLKADQLQFEKAISAIEPNRLQKELDNLSYKNIPELMQESEKQYAPFIAANKAFTQRRQEISEELKRRADGNTNSQLANSPLPNSQLLTVAKAKP